MNFFFSANLCVCVRLIIFSAQTECSFHFKLLLQWIHCIHNEHHQFQLIHVEMHFSPKKISLFVCLFVWFITWNQKKKSPEERRKSHSYARTHAHQTNENRRKRKPCAIWNDLIATCNENKAPRRRKKRKLIKKIFAAQIAVFICFVHLWYRPNVVCTCYCWYFLWFGFIWFQILKELSSFYRLFVCW